MHFHGFQIGGKPMHYEKVRFKRKELYEKVWSTPMTNLSKEYGLSDVGLAKICKKYNIPPLVAIGPKKRRGRNPRRRHCTLGTPDYTMEFIWIMSKYNACRREDIDELVPAPLPSDRWFSII